MAIQWEPDSLVNVILNDRRKIMNTKFNTLSMEELENTNGGVDWGAVAGGAGLVVACIGIGVAVAAVPILALPALGEGAVCVISGVGGYTMGYGFTH